MVIIILVLVAAVALIALPQLWVHQTIEKHAKERPDLPGTGGEFARHVLDGMKLQHVKVEPTELGNHYDPEARAVRLEPRFFSGRSVSAVAIAAHEVGHAMQHAVELPMFERRLRIAKQAQALTWIAQACLWSAPIFIILNKGVTALVLNIAGFALVGLLSFAVQALTLPVEFDASFKRAMPLLKDGRFLAQRDLGAAHELLRAAAYTYVAALIRSLITIPLAGRGVRL
ncbi:MAG: zinc metallopeptidase [Hyphomicrobium aestuarii]|nr:zinc metallopeptidase [Hyphomicrobium aestuarii]